MGAELLNGQRYADVPVADGVEDAQGAAHLHEGRRVVDRAIGSCIAAFLVGVLAEGLAEGGSAQ